MTLISAALLESESFKFSSLVRSDLSQKLIVVKVLRKYGTVNN